MVAFRLGLALAVLVNTTSARAQGPTAASELGSAGAAGTSRRLVQLVYSGPLGCDESSGLRTAIEARSPDVSFVELDGGQRVLEVRVEQIDSGRWRARVHDAGSSEPGREVSAESCGLLIDALALIISVALAPGGDWSEPPERADATSTPARNLPGARGDSPVAPTPTRERASGHVWQAGLHGAAVFGTTPRPAPGGGLHVAWRVDPDRPGTLGGFLGVDATLTDTAPRQGAWASSRHLALQLGVCLETLLLGGLRLPACLVGEGGLLSVAGQGLDERRSHSVPLFSLGVAAMPGLRLSRAISLDSQVSLLLPTTRPSFYAEGPERDIFQVAALQSRVWLGVTVRLTGFR